MTSKQNNTPITQAEVDSFAQKLEQWGSGLPPKEQALLQLMLARVNAVGSDDLQAHDDGSLPHVPIRTGISGLFSPLLSHSGVLASGWVEAGDPWVQGSGGNIGRFINPAIRR